MPCCLLRDDESCPGPIHNRVVVVGNAGQLGDIPDAANRGSAYLSDTLGKHVNRRKDVVRLLVQHQVIVAEVRRCQMPVEVLGLDIQSEVVRNDRIHGVRNGLRFFGGQVGRGCQRAGCFVSG